MVILTTNLFRIEGDMVSYNVNSSLVVNNNRVGGGFNENDSSSQSSGGGDGSGTHHPEPGDVQSASVNAVTSIDSEVIHFEFSHACS